MSEVKGDSSSGAPNESLWELAERQRSLVTILGITALLAITLAAYWTAMRGDFIWDDDYYVTNNPNLRTWEGLKNIWVPDARARTQFYPLTNTAFWIQYRLWGRNPLGYHVVNVVMHAGAAMLLWAVLRKIKVRGAWAVAAVFAVHPVQVETVAWVTELKNILSAFFYFASMLVFFRYSELMDANLPATAPAQSSGSEPIFNREWFSLPSDPTRVYALAVFLFACSLLSKSVSATMPAAILLITWWKHGRIRLKEDVLPLLPFFVMGIGMGVFTSVWEAKTIGASGSQWDYSPTVMGEIGAHCIIAGRAVWFYVGKLFLPYNLIFNYPRWNISAAAAWQYLFPLAAVAVLGAMWCLRRTIGRGPLAASLYFVGTLVPALGFINVYPMQYSFVADHFQYMACIGIIALTIGALARGAEKLVALDVLNPAAAPAATFVLLGALAVRSSRQGMIYADLNTLWRDTILRTGGAYTTSWFAANNYGVLLLNNNQIDAADKWFNHAIKVNEKNAPAWFNRGLVAERRGQLADALAYHQNALKWQGDYGPAKVHIAELLARMGRPQESIAYYRKLVEENPDEEPLRVNYGFQLFRAGHVQEAAGQYNEAIRINPDSLPAHLNLANALGSVGHDLEALQEYGRVVQLDPNNAMARFNVGNILARNGYLSDAAKAFQLAIDLDSKYPEPVNALGMVYLKQGKYEDAIAQFNKVLKLSPTFPKAKQNLDEALDLLAHPEKRPATTQSTTQSSTKPTTRGS